jgi:pyruvate/2-oxoglutarate dehydrogenase complex dihydrolipoamide acyltransferase (E2) component
VIYPVVVPQLTETMEEGTLLKWLKTAGDRVEKKDILYQIETDKSTMDVESVDAGYLCKVLAPEGQVVKVGEEIARIADTREERGEQ